MNSHRNKSTNGKYGSIEHGYQAMDTDAESHGFMQRRKINNKGIMIMSKNFNSRTGNNGTS
jgi:hypothetical protein